MKLSVLKSLTLLSYDTVEIFNLNIQEEPFNFNPLKIRKNVYDSVFINFISENKVVLSLPATIYKTAIYLEDILIEIGDQQFMVKNEGTSKQWISTVKQIEENKIKYEKTINIDRTYLIILGIVLLFVVSFIYNQVDAKLEKYQKYNRATDIVVTQNLHSIDNLFEANNIFESMLDYKNANELKGIIPTLLDSVYYETAKELMSNNNWEDAKMRLEQISKEDYKSTKDMLAIVTDKLKTKSEKATKELKEKHISQYLSYKKQFSLNYTQLDIDQFNMDIAIWQSFEKSEFKKYFTDFNNVNNIVYKNFRKNWINILKYKGWENNFEFVVENSSATILTAIHSSFSNNKYKKDAYELLYPKLTELKFKQFRVKWYKGDNEYTYWEL